MKAFFIIFLVLTGICLAAQVFGYMKHQIEERFENRGKENP